MIKKDLKINDINPCDGFVVAETACGHEGDIKKLFLLIDAAHNAKSSAIKFQIFIPEERSHKKHSEWLIFNKLTLTKNEWLKATKYAHKKNLYVFADVFGEKGLSIAKSCNVDGYKIHSEDMLNFNFIKKVAAMSKITMLGVGAIRGIELYRLIEELKDLNLLKDIILIPGVQVFPTPLEAHNLSEISDLIHKYASINIKIGFADHLAGDCVEAITLPQKALVMGAVVIEKHITIDRDLKWEDYESALDANTFKNFIEQIRNTANLIEPLSSMNKHEIQYRNMFKKMPLSRNFLKAGTIIQEKDIEFKKQDHISVPISSIDLIGKKLQKNVLAGEIIRFKSLHQNIGAIIVVRNSSSRLPGKALKKINEIETIALLIKRIKRCKNIDCIILATSTHKSDDVFEFIANREKIEFFRGSLENVAKRFYDAAKYYDLDQIVRITGDDILRDEKMIDKAIISHLHSSCNVSFTRNVPYGCASEIFTFQTLKTIMETAIEVSNTEYLEYYLENDRYFSKNEVFSNYKNIEGIRLTLDYQEDFILFEKIFNHFKSINKPNFSVQMVTEWLKNNPKLLEINRNMKTKFDQLDLNVELRI